MKMILLALCAGWAAGQDPASLPEVKLDDLRPLMSSMPEQSLAQASKGAVSCTGQVSALHPDWDYGDLQQACGSGAEPACIVCMARRHPELEPEHLVDNCLPDENGDDSDLLTNDCYTNGGSAPLPPAPPPPAPPMPQPTPGGGGYHPAPVPGHHDSPSGRNCAGRLAQMRPNWSSGDLQAACQGVDAECVISMASQHRNWGARELNSACRGGVEPGHGGGYGRNCAGRLAELHRNWSSGQLQAACQGVDGDCVISMATQHLYWGAGELNQACRGGSGGWHGGRNCAGRLAELHRIWSSGQLQAACQGVDADCVISMATQHPIWSAGELNRACSRGGR